MPKVLWVITFQFDTTTDGRKFKIASSAADEHTRQSVLSIVEKFTPADDLDALDQAFVLWGGPTAKCCGATTRPSSSEETLRTFCEDQAGIGFVPTGQP